MLCSSSSWWSTDAFSPSAQEPTGILCSLLGKWRKRMPVCAGPMDKAASEKCTAESVECRNNWPAQVERLSRSASNNASQREEAKKKPDTCGFKEGWLSQLPSIHIFKEYKEKWRPDTLTHTLTLNQTRLPPPCALLKSTRNLTVPLLWKRRLLKQD